MFQFTVNITFHNPDIFIRFITICYVVSPVGSPSCLNLTLLSYIPISEDPSNRSPNRCFAFPEAILLSIRLPVADAPKSYTFCPPTILAQTSATSNLEHVLSSGRAIRGLPMHLLRSQRGCVCAIWQTCGPD